jgi:hypothetical protein
MKKLAYIIILFAGFGCFSCKKQYECKCTYPGLKDDDITNLKMTEEDAKAWCNSQNIEYEAQSGSCSLSPN